MGGLSSSASAPDLKDLREQFDGRTARARAQSTPRVSGYRELDETKKKLDAAETALSDCNRLRTAELTTNRSLLDECGSSSAKKNADLAATRTLLDECRASSAESKRLCTVDIRQQVERERPFVLGHIARDRLLTFRDGREGDVLALAPEREDSPLQVWALAEDIPKEAMMPRIVLLPILTATSTPSMWGRIIAVKLRPVGKTPYFNLVAYNLVPFASSEPGRLPISVGPGVPNEPDNLWRTIQLDRPLGHFGVDADGDVFLLSTRASAQPSGPEYMWAFATSMTVLPNSMRDWRLSLWNAHQDGAHANWQRPTTATTTRTSTDGTQFLTTQVNEKPENAALWTLLR
jgi:hypothetical protein